jgi:transcriptional regulator with XRE-family HTH domain
MDVGRTLDDLMRRRQLTQSQVAKDAGVSQPTISRVLLRSPKRRGAAYRRLCIYIQEQQQADKSAPEDVLDAVRRIWDGSESHAAALAELIEASKRLWPDLREPTEDRPSTAPSSSGRD